MVKDKIALNAVKYLHDDLFKWKCLDMDLLNRYDLLVDLLLMIKGKVFSNHVGNDDCTILNHKDMFILFV